MKKHICKILSNTEIADKIFQLEIAGSFPQAEFKPGKFLHIKCSGGIDPLLRRPMSICDISDTEDKLTVLYRKEGAGTTQLSLRKPEENLDFLAPLGNNFDLAAVESGETVLLIGGGIGVPPLYYLGRKLKAKGCKIVSILGFQSAKDVFWEHEFKDLGDNFITTIDGSHGVAGLVTDCLSQVSNWDAMYSCGPTAMLKALQSHIPEKNKTFISLEERMGCGVGACLACVCDYADEYQSDKNYSRICTEGPVYPLHAVKL